MLVAHWLSFTPLPFLLFLCSDGCEAVVAGGASQPKKSPTKPSPKQKTRFFVFRRSPKKASSPQNKASKNKASPQNKDSPSQERPPQKNATPQNEASFSQSKATPAQCKNPHQPSLFQTSPLSQSAPVTRPAIPVGKYTNTSLEFAQQVTTTC